MDTADIQQRKQEGTGGLIAGVLVLGCVLLAAEILLSRILSVIFFYHFAFLVVSVALFGMTVGALIVHLAPHAFPPDRTRVTLTSFMLPTSALLTVSFLSLFVLPSFLDARGWGTFMIPVFYVVLSVPFVCFGIILTLVFTRFPTDIDRLYGANMAGSALGCLVVIVALNGLMNAGAAVFFLAFLCVVAALCFARAAGVSRRWLRLTVPIALVYICLTGWAAVSGSIRPLWAKGESFVAHPNLYERWNFFSTVSVRRSPREPFGWGYSSKVRSLNITAQELTLLLDYGAGSAFTRFEDLADLDYLRYDVTALAYYVRSNKDVAVLGSGGGRDLLTAVLFGAERVVGVEINPDINALVFDVFRDFSGGILRLPQVHLVVDDGRSFLVKSREKFDVIQASVVSSLAATFSGGFALTENSLHTVEAWDVFLAHLKKEGILTFSHYFYEDNPALIYRLTALAGRCLHRRGLSDLRRYVVLVRQEEAGGKGIGMGTLLVSLTPFSAAELDRIEAVCREMGFEVVLSGRTAVNPRFVDILSAPSDAALRRLFSFNVTPPTDESPFFFYFSLPRDLLFDRSADSLSDALILHGAWTLRKLFVSIVFMGSFFILLPLLFHLRTRGLRHLSAGWVAYFFLLGAGFMLIEMAFMQRLGIFLGHPIYGLAVVLFALLLACGAGSLLSRRFDGARRSWVVFFGLGVVLLFQAFCVPRLAVVAQAAPGALKAAVAVLLVGSAGLLMGMPFPLGMKQVRRRPALLVVYWGVNGFASVCGSIVAAASLVYLGFQKTLLLGLCCYAAAGVFFFLQVARTGEEPI